MFLGLIIFRNPFLQIVLLAVLSLIGCILLSRDLTFKIRSNTIERGIRHMEKWGPYYKDKPIKRGRKKIVTIFSILLIIVILLVVFSSLNFLPKTETGKLYFQSTESDWGDGNFAMSNNLLNGEEKSNDMWHHPNSFISTPLRQPFKVTEITFMLYHKIVPSDGTYFKIECMFIDVNGRVQSISSKSVMSIENSRSTSYTFSFFPNSPQLLPNERLYLRITVATSSAWDWYWGDANYPSQIIYKGIPQYEEIPIF